jgi:hypothetical protein
MVFRLNRVKWVEYQGADSFRVRRSSERRKGDERVTGVLELQKDSKMSVRSIEAHEALKYIQTREIFSGRNRSISTGERLVLTRRSGRGPFEVLRAR